MRDREARDAVGWIEGRILIEAVSKRILKIVVHPEPGADDGLRAEGTPRQTDSRLGQELRVVGSEDCVCDSRLSNNDPVRENEVGAPS